MDYEQKYTEALEKIREGLQPLQDGTKISGVTRAFLEEVFPELKESEDERIRKDIIILVKDWWDRVNKDNISTKEQMIAWLEKQKPTDKEIVFRPLAGTDIIAAANQALEKIEIGKKVVLAFNGAYIPVNGKTVAEICNEYDAWIEKQGEKKATDKVEPKFHEGDWVVCEVTGSICQIKNCIKNATNHKYGYDLTNGGYIATDETNHFHIWTIDDAKDGDVLVDVYGNIGIYQKNDDFDWSSYCSLGSNGGFRCFAIEHELDRSHPATKEQRDLLFAKMKEDGYEWSDKDRKLIKIVK